MNYLVTKELVGKNKIECPKNIWIDEFFSLRSKACFSEGNDKITNELKGISKSF